MQEHFGFAQCSYFLAMVFSKWCSNRQFHQFRSNIDVVIDVWISVFLSVLLSLLLTMLSHSAPASIDLTPIQIEDLLLSILSYTNPFELSSSFSLVSQTWNKLIFNNKLIWLYHCDVLWKNKSFVAPKAVNLKRKCPSNAFKVSYIDRERNVINMDELTSIKWQFRFKNHLHNTAEMSVSFKTFSLNVLFFS